MPFLRIYRGNVCQGKYPLQQEQTRIGRSEDSDIVLTDPTVSRIHALLVREGSHHVLIDRSTNGTYVDDKRVERVLLADHSSIRIGEFLLLYDTALSDAPHPGEPEPRDQATIVRPLSVRPEAGPLHEPCVLSVRLHDRSLIFRIDRPSVRIGRAPANGIRIDHPSVSRHHASLEVRADGLYVKDLGSKKGTFLQGVRIEEALARMGDCLRFGEVEGELGPDTPEAEAAAGDVSPFIGMVGQSAAMRRIFSLIQRASAGNVPVLLQGETGTGKEVVARAIHALSDRAQGPLVVINCGAIPVNLIESEFFGHKKGAFTGSEAERVGAFERADRGTIFLDEIGELPYVLQPRLLRVIEDKAILRVGGNIPIPTDFRLVTATNRKLGEEVQKGAFRQDLYYRISVVPITLPPLRERKEDIPLLVKHFLALKAVESSRDAASLDMTAEAVDKLMRHDWPGNVRELKNVIERAILMTDRDVIQAEDLSFVPLGKQEIDASLVQGNLSLEEVEKRVILHTLRAHKGDRKATAEVLGVAYSTLWAKIKKYNVEP